MRLKKKIRTTSEILEEIGQLPDLDIDNDPEFSESYTRGRIVEDNFLDLTLRALYNIDSSINM